MTRDEMQQQAIDAIDGERLKGVASTFVQMPTQTGKTRTACKWMRRRLERSPGSRIMVVAHMGELLDQWGRELTAMGIPFVVEKAEQRAYPKMSAIPSIRVCLASKDSLQKRRLSIWPRDYFDAIHEDEAHLATATTWKNIHDHFQAFRVGWSATIDRLDGVPLSKSFESKAYTYPIDQAIANGHRVEFRAVACDLSIDLKGIKANTKGDLQPGELEARVGPHLEDLAKAVRTEMDRCGIGKAIAFLPSRKLAYAYAQFLSAIGVSAQAVCGENPARRTIIETFRSGGCRVLCNNKLLGMGFNDPDIDAVIHLQPTTSRAWFDQMCLSEDTEILTMQGWKGPDEIHRHDLAAAFDRRDGSVRWSPIKSIVDRPLGPDEDMYSLVSPGLDIRVTGNHKMVWRPFDRNHVETEWGLERADWLSDRLGSYEIPLAGTQNAPGLMLSDDEIRFIGWFLTDGHVSKNRRSITIAQADHQPYHEQIVSCLKGCNFRFSVYVQKRSTQFSDSSIMLRYCISRGDPHRRVDRHLRGWKHLDHYIDKDFSPSLERLDRRQLGILLEAIHFGDGSKQNNYDWTQRSYHISTGNKTFADRLQSLCVRRGYKCNISTGSWNKNPTYVIHIKDQSCRHVGGCNTTDRPTLKPCPFVPGERVWCIETEMGTIVTRRNGKVAVVGNSGRCGATRPDKTKGFLIFPSWESDLSLMGPTDIFAANESAKVREVARRLASKCRDSDPKAIIDRAKEIVEADERRERDAARRKLRYQVSPRDVRYKRREYNPIGSVIRACGIDPVRPVARFGLDPKTLGDLDRKLASLGFNDTPGFSDAAKAELVRFWEDRVDSGMSTFKQCDYLRRRGWDYAKVLDMTIHDAKREIGRLHAGR